MTLQNDQNGCYLLLIIATPDSLGTLRFPPLCTLKTKEEASRPIGPYFGYPQFINSSQSLKDPMLIKPLLKRTISEIFGQNMDFFWKEDDGFEAQLNPEDPNLQAFIAEKGEHLAEPFAKETRHPVYLRLIRVTIPMAESHWPSFPDILRSLPKTKIRAAYLKIFQILMGQSQENTEALSVDELKKILTKETKI